MLGPQAWLRALGRSAFLCASLSMHGHSESVQARGQPQEPALSCSFQVSLSLFKHLYPLSQLILVVGVCVNVSVCGSMSAVARVSVKNCVSQFFPHSLEIPGIEPRLSALTTGTPSHWADCQPQDLHP